MLSFHAHGHPQLRATHAKTLEFTADAEVTGRATCVLGVSARLPDVAVAGPLRLTLSLGSESFTLDAVGNSAWHARDSAVLRRSSRRLADTFATDASAAAADLPRSLVAALTDPAAELAVEVERRPAPPTLVRFRLDPASDSRLRAEAAAADELRAEDAGARARLQELGLSVGGVAGGRTLSVSSGPAGRWSGRADEVIGWPAELTVLAAVSEPDPVVLALDATPAEITLIAAANPQAAIVLRSDAADLARLLGSLGRPAAKVVRASAEDPERPRFGSGTEPDWPDRGEVFARIGAVARAAPTPLDPATFVRGLLAQQVTARTIALALAALPGWSRRSAYDFVLSLQG